MSLALTTSACFISFMQSVNEAFFLNVTYISTSSESALVALVFATDIVPLASIYTSL